jgi:hypothetical protein
LKFYYEGARTVGLSEKQLAIRACSIDTSGNSPYQQPVVLPGLPLGNNASKRKSRVASLVPCTIIPPPPNEVGGKRLSRCTILPYHDEGIANYAERQRKSTIMSYHSVSRPSKPETSTVGAEVDTPSSAPQPESTKRRGRVAKSRVRNTMVSLEARGLW